MQPIDYKKELEKQSRLDGDGDGDGAVGHNPAVVYPSETESDATKACCGPACDCNASAPHSPVKIAVAVVVLLSAAAVLVVKIAEKSETPARDDGPSVIVPNRASAIPKAALPLNSFLELNTAAAQMDAVFVMVLTESDNAVEKAIALAVQTAAHKLSTKGMTAGVYSLSSSSPDYKTIDKRHTLPGVVVFTGGGKKAMVSMDKVDAGMITGEITESKLLQAYVAASMGIGGGGCNCAKGSSCGGD